MVVVLIGELKSPDKCKWHTWRGEIRLLNVCIRLCIGPSHLSNGLPLDPQLLNVGMMCERLAVCTSLKLSNYSHVILLVDCGLCPKFRGKCSIEVRLDGLITTVDP